jgi:hypothetical protein
LSDDAVAIIPPIFRPERSLHVSRARLAIALSIFAAPLAAQSPGDLGLQATAAYAAIWNGTANPTSTLSKAFGARFNGRIALRVGPGTFVGLNAGSWMYFPGAGQYDNVFGEEAGAVVSAVIASPYVQWYPRHFGALLFVRGGLGYASVVSYYPAQVSQSPAPLVETHSHHASASAGVGVDIPLHRHLALTISADYTAVLGTATGFEPTSATTVGLGLTVR